MLHNARRQLRHHPGLDIYLASSLAEVGNNLRLPYKGIQAGRIKSVHGPELSGLLWPHVHKGHYRMQLCSSAPATPAKARGEAQGVELEAPPGTFGAHQALRELA